jgi:cytochrome c oxidase assembly protein subunit 20
MERKRIKIEAKKEARRREKEQQERESERRMKEEEQRRSWSYWAKSNLKFW